MTGGIIYLFLFIIVILRLFNQKNTKGGGARGGGAGPNPSRENRMDTGFGGTGPKKATNAGRGAIAGRPASGRRPLASDGHRVPRGQDISCRRFGHVHEEFDTPRYIPHSDPEDGYIVLNGIKMKRTEADRYEDRI